MDLKAKAVMKARRQAELMVNSIGQAVNKAILISDLEMELTNLLSGKVAGVRIRGSSSIENEPIDVPIEFEKIKVTAKVDVKFAMN